MKKRIIAIAVMAAVAVSGFAVLTGCGGSEPTPTPAPDTTTPVSSAPVVSAAPSTYEQVKEKVYTANGTFLASHSELAALINENINHYGYESGIVTDHDVMSMIRFTNGDYITVSDTMITVNSTMDSDMSAILTKACAEVLTDSRDWNDLYVAISQDLHGINTIYGADGTVSSQVKFDHLRITLAQNSTENMIIYSIQPNQ